jgi:hypothetical protein
MAERRMFAKTIIDSDAFLDMPMSTQVLYFHLSMRADDDGFINNPKKIQRMIGSGDDDMRILCAKSFIIPFESGVVVIKHWRISNYLRADRYKPTVYQDEMNRLEIKENGSYTKKDDGIPAVYQVVDERDTQVSIGKDRLGKDSKEDTPDKPAKPQKHKHGEYKHVLLTSDEYLRLCEEWGEPELLRMIKELDEGIEVKGYKYKNHNLALRKWKTNEKNRRGGYSKPLPVHNRDTMLDLD